jgi:GT2 family glycosyltransferase
MLKTMIAVPCMDRLDLCFVQSLVELRPVDEVVHEFVSTSLVYKSRDDLAERAIWEDADYVLWLDSDMTFPDTLLEDLLRDMDGRDIVCGLFHMRRPPYKPALYRKLRQGLTPAENESEGYNDHPKDQIFEVEGCGFACVLLRTNVLRDVRKRYHECFAPLPGYGEDLSFCIRARALGYRIWCDPQLEIGHRAETIVTSKTFEAYRAANPELVDGCARKNKPDEGEGTC